LLLIDEAAGRRIAIRLGLKVTGVVGVLIEARRRREIPELTRVPQLEQGVKIVSEESGFSSGVVYEGS
jgi:predicted nucleic acid-binding protein